MSPKQGAIHFNVDKTVLRDIIEARSVRDKQSFYYVVGSIFSGMSFTMILLKSDNYSAITFLTMIGMFFYTCISCQNVNYEEDEAETQEDPNPTPTNTPIMKGMTGVDDVEEAEEFFLDYLSKDNKIILFKQLFHELVGTDFSDSEIEHLIESSEEQVPVIDEEIPEKEDAVSAWNEMREPVPAQAQVPVQEQAQVDQVDQVLTQLRQVEAETAARNLARAHTSFSDSELRQLEEPMVEGKEKTL
jgi:hypothetical protein